jgi:hypothetical protein
MTRHAGSAPYASPRSDPSLPEHVLWVLTSFESFDSLYTGRGMSTSRAIQLLTETAERTLYAKPYMRAHS